MKQLLFFAVLIATLASCSPRLTPFTANLRNKYEWTDADLEKIQFYLSDDIILYREIKDGNAKIADGAIKIKNGRKVEEIKFPKRTPGVFVLEPKTNQFAISFETTDDNRYLMFGPSKKRGAEFVLLAADWKKDRGRISYNDKIYYTSDESAYASLMVDLTKARKLSVKRKTVKGRTIK